MSQFLSSLQYSDSSRTPSADRQAGFGKVVDLAELKTGLESAGWPNENTFKSSTTVQEKTPISPGRTQVRSSLLRALLALKSPAFKEDFLISALLNEETGAG